MNKFRTVSVLAAAAIVVTACTDAPKSTASAPTPSGSTPVYGQRISWRDCGGGFQCGSIRVPLDYAHPTGRLLGLAVIRLPAEGGQRKGSLVLNPGGPGGSGVEFARGSARSFGADLRRNFDIVGFDPRGVGQSRPAVRCLTGKQLDRFFEADTSPTDQAELNNLVDVSKMWADECKTRIPTLLPYVGTANAARDIDVLRAALGDKGLTYYGASYGTFLGAYYAQEFPKHVRALVLDGAIDPKLSAAEINIEQAKGFDTATRAFADDCVKTKDCPLGSGSTDEALDRLGRLFDETRKKPLYNGLKDGRVVDGSMVELGVAAALYNKQTWPVLKLALKSAIDQNDGTTLLRLGDLLIERNKDGSYSNQTEANMAINCIDKPYDRDLGAWKDQAARAKKEAPLFGQFVVWGTLPCAYWPVQDNTKPQAFTANGAKPIVVVGTTRDPATPYKWAQGLASQLKSGVLLSLDGDGHTAYLQGNPCITTAVDRYLLTGTPPRKNTMCR
ncbi:alpha/beta hydrolase [Actinoallomurus rhizosphaericola]|uniref:alpha/beta hydrolase n=1 Tax=Actinoallomurus rhizosphaericola TaxID=2952536 RepID=UPI00209368C8|nr:alpha/beta hydrolase [Actinoallomurus rhizosphaericola]MCO5995786.1 alpha/beta hydrolase [Actinoallomurus rhizosphaericola]